MWSRSSPPPKRNSHRPPDRLRMAIQNMVFVTRQIRLLHELRPVARKDVLTKKHAVPTFIAKVCVVIFKSMCSNFIAKECVVIFKRPAQSPASVRLRTAIQNFFFFQPAGNFDDHNYPWHLLISCTGITTEGSQVHVAALWLPELL